ncbi:hypothetical protein [Micromonospora sp. KC213]|uniref:hypothetical protein n=1 Tax=Micromonospora sp. KC213 TaxID=2530378 RepID=UPI001404CE3B|nr:hypothetical protein [Micromonospora sp. KC213]
MIRTTRPANGADWREFEDNVDWIDPGHVKRVLRVYETLVDALPPEAVASTRKFMERQGFDLDAEGRISPKSDSALVAAATMPRSLTALRDPGMILDSFDRINRALPTDPAQAIGSAKELVEATAKTVPPDPDSSLFGQVATCRTRMPAGSWSRRPGRPDRGTGRACRSRPSTVPFGVRQTGRSLREQRGRPR